LGKKQYNNFSFNSDKLSFVVENYVAFLTWTWCLAHFRNEWAL